MHFKDISGLMTDVLTPFVAGQSSLLVVFLQVATASSEDMRGLATAPLTLLAELVVVSDPAIICCMCSSVMLVEVVTVTVMVSTCFLYLTWSLSVKASGCCHARCCI